MLLWKTLADRPSYLEEDPSTTVIDRQRRLEGYELYMVEQWACSRIDPTFVITTFTGDPSHSVLANVLSVPRDEEAWSPRLRVYFKAVSQFHARPKETSLGILMVTNLSGFPSALTVIQVPGGDIKLHREDFIVNENLKRMGCSGRAGLSLSSPTGVTQAKFHQLYKTSDRIPFYDSVIELVRLCQVALTLFGKLGPEYVDGLLCDVTERGINDWWTELGSDYYDSEPRDGILGPTTVAALLGLLMGARNRLNAFGAPVSKDAFETTGLKRGIAYFQKSQKLARTRRLDRATHSRLCKATSRAANGEGWMVPKGVKSTVAELSGKGGDMVMGMVGARDRIGIAEIETVDFGRFIQLTYGERAKWLWFGKPRKVLSQDILSPVSAEENPLFGKAHPIHSSTLFHPPRSGHSLDLDSTNMEVRANDEELGTRDWNVSDPGLAGDSPPDKEIQLRKGVLKSVTGKMTDARSGFGRIKDAVGIPGLRGHYHRASKEENSLNPSLDDRSQARTERREGRGSLPSSRAAPPASPPSATRSEADTAGKSPLRSSFEELRGPRAESISRDTPSGLKSENQPLTVTSLPREITVSLAQDGSSVDVKPCEEESPLFEGKAIVTASRDVSNPPDTILRPEFEYIYPQESSQSTKVSALLRRTQSTSRLVSRRGERRHDAWWPRQPSFSDAEDAILTWADINLSGDETITQDAAVSEAWTREGILSYRAKYMHEQIVDVEDQVGHWVQQKLREVEELHDEAARDREKLNNVYDQRLEDYRQIRGASTTLLSQERTNLTEAIKDVEMLGAKLEYELNALGLKVDDLEDSVAEFDRLVMDVEARAEVLEAGEKIQGSWFRWSLGLIGGTSSVPVVMGRLSQ